MGSVKYPVSEIFYSIDGEGIRTGAPAVFIRLFGCNLDCSYCDTKYACKTDSSGNADFEWMPLEKVIYAVESFEPCRKVTLTGGEPLIHKEIATLITTLERKGYEVNIETNGSVSLNQLLPSLGGRRTEEVSPYFFTMDWKSLSSGESDKMLRDNLSCLTERDVLKFVVGDENDLNQMKELLEDYPGLAAQVYVSPVWGEITPERIVEYVLNNGLTDVRVQVQLHKIIWDPNMRGV